MSRLLKGRTPKGFEKVAKGYAAKLDGIDSDGLGVGLQKSGFEKVRREPQESVVSDLDDDYGVVEWKTAVKKKMIQIG